MKTLQKYDCFQYSLVERRFIEFMKSTTESEISHLQNDDILVGLLLSDASIMKLQSNRNTSCFVLALNNKNNDLIIGLDNHLRSSGVLSKVTLSIPTKWKPMARLTTKAYQLFGDMRKNWYPKSLKVVPNDIILTPRSIAYWFMGDGSSVWKKPYDRVVVSFATNSFSIKEVEFLQRQLLTFGIMTKISDFGRGPVIRFSSVPDVERFMNIVEPYILDSFKYKIKKPKYTKSGQKRMNTIMIQGLEMNK